MGTHGKSPPHSASFEFARNAQFSDRNRRARRLKENFSVGNKKEMSDESFFGNKLKFGEENLDSLFIRRLKVRRLTESDDDDGKDEEEDGDTAKSDPNKDTEDSDDEDSDDNDDAEDPDPKEVVQKISQTMSY